MSLAAGLLTPIPGQVTVEVIDGTNARRITRRFDAPVALLENSARLAEAVEPYGTADGVGVGAANTRRTPPAEKVWSAAKLVEVRAVPKVDGRGQGNPELCLVEKVYEETPYTRDESTQTDAQGAILSADRTVVCAVGQSVPVAPEGYARVLLGSSRDFGRLVYRVRDVRGDGVTGTALHEDGEGVIVEDGSFVTITEPVRPAPGLYESWSSTPEAGYWRVSFSRVAADQLAAGARIRRDKSVRPDGSISETVTEAGADPACATSLTAGTVLVIGQSDFTRQGGIVARTKQYLRLPADSSHSAIVNWTRPGLVTLGGTIGTGGSAFLRILPPVERQYSGTRTYAYGDSSGLTPELPWQADDWATWTVAGTVIDPERGAEAVLDAGQAPRCLTDLSLVSGATTGKWNGKVIVSLSVDAYSSPSARPTGEIVTGGGDLRAYAVAMDGQFYYERITERASV